MQAALKLVLEPIFEADFLPCSYGFRPKRRAQDAIAEIHHFELPRLPLGAGCGYRGCFDSISHSALMDRVRAGSKTSASWRWLRRSSRPGILGEDRQLRKTNAGTPQGSVPVPAAGETWPCRSSTNTSPGCRGVRVQQRPPKNRARRRRHGLPNYRPCRYADDWCLVSSTARRPTPRLSRKTSPARLSSATGPRASAGQDPDHAHR